MAMQGSRRWLGPLGLLLITCGLYPLAVTIGLIQLRIGSFDAVVIHGFLVTADSPALIPVMVGAILLGMALVACGIYALRASWTSRRVP